MSLLPAPCMQEGYYCTLAIVFEGIFCSCIDIVFLEQATHINMILRAFGYPATTAYRKAHLVLFTIELQWIWLELLKKAIFCEGMTPQHSSEGVTAVKQL